jgi:hypothetical protein
MSDSEDKPKKRPVRAVKSSSRKKKVKSEKTKSGKVNKNTISQKAIKASVKNLWGGGAISSDTLRQASCYAKDHNFNKEDIMRVLKLAHQLVEKRKAVRIMPKDFEAALHKNKKINRESVEY